MTPDAFSGLWRRRSLAIGDAAPSEPAAVHWIQWGEHFVDLRIPDAAEARSFCGPGAFGGTTSWAEPVLTWHHALDSGPGADADAGTVRWLGDDLIEERGVAVIDGAPTTYVEVWARVGPRPAHGRQWSPGGGAIAVEAGPHCIAAVVDATGAWAAGRSEVGPTGDLRLVEVAGHTGLLAVLHPALLGPA